MRARTEASMSAEGNKRYADGRITSLKYLILFRSASSDSHMFLQRMISDYMASSLFPNATNYRI
jgi:hypothetical protein